ncbi:hypothetical protein BdWA1_000437 [Babesia duncani]|uniref:Uncharacterized protein n=1 Tax=Babesia duncani TaxID=323732 RepID=A0AAD9PMB9_9APIC|nr:hypothetical protein BdWA1_000437 [Babesia duncani]
MCLLIVADLLAFANIKLKLHNRLIITTTSVGLFVCQCIQLDSALYRFNYNALVCRDACRGSSQRGGFIASNQVFINDNDPGINRKFTLHASIRSQRNRFNKSVELFRRVKKRRLENKNRLLDIRIANFRNDKCNLQLLTLPVSPALNLSNIVPFKTIPEMRSQVPFNPTPILRTIGFRFKPRENTKYERFKEPYPMDKVMEILDARGHGYYSRMSTKFKITGPDDQEPTPMAGQRVSPGGGVGRGYGFGGSRKLEPKRKPLAIEEFKHLKEPTRVNTLEEYRESKQCALEKLKEMGTTEWRVMDEAFPKGSSAKIPTIDEACNEGDIFRNPRYLGEYRYKYWYHPIYGSASLPGEVKDAIEQYNREKPQKAILYADFYNDIIYCHSNGTIVHMLENQQPYSREKDTFTLEGEDEREPRFVILARVGFIKEHSIKIGQEFPHVSSAMRRQYFDNLFARPKTVRHPVYLPQGDVTSYHANR